MKLGLINSAWLGTAMGTAEGIRLTKEIGFDTIDIFADPLEIDARERRLIRHSCRDADLPIRSVVGITLGIPDFNASVRQFHIHRAKAYLDLAYELEAANFLIVLGEYIWERQVILPQDQWKWAVEGLQILGEHAAGLRLEIAVEIEPFRLSIVNNIENMSRFLNDVNSKAVGANIDISHLVLARDGPERISELAGRIMHVHLSDCDGKIHGDLPAGRGCVPFEAYLNALRNAGFNGPVSIELEYSPEPDKIVELGARGVHRYRRHPGTAAASRLKCEMARPLDPVNRFMKQSPPTNLRRQLPMSGRISSRISTMAGVKRSIRVFVFTVLVQVLLVGGRMAAAQDPDNALPDAPFRLEQGWRALLNDRDLSGWQAVPGWRGDPSHLNEWFRTSAVTWSRLGSPRLLSAKPEPGPILVNGIPSHTTNLVSRELFGDVELYVEFMIAKGSNSGVYLHGLYEVQIFDSWGADTAMTSGDAGGIYERWENDRGFGGSAPFVNASRRPGEWQSYHIWFRAPRFDGTRKTADAQFLKVVYNGIVVQRAFRCGGPTRSALERPEAPTNPIMLQGDHGPVAFRNIYIRALRDADLPSGSR